MAKRTTLPKESLDLLQELTSLSAPSGFEKPVQDLFYRTVKEVADEVHTDAYGNVWAVLYPPPSSPSLKVLVSGHGDEIGIMVNHIEEKGLLRFVPIGGVDPAILLGRRIRLLSPTGEDLIGIVGSVPVHLKEKGSEKGVKFEDLFLDCGFTSREEAEKYAPVGTPGTLLDTFQLLGKTRAVSRAFDNRIGVFSALEVFLRVYKRRKDLRVTLIALSTIQEEIGGAGALTVTRTINPDLAFVVDVTHATDVPGISHSKFGKVELGKGPTVTHGSSNHPLLVERIVEISKKFRIPLQHEAVSRFTGTDTDLIFRSTRGIPSALISLPNRYMHTSSEVIDLTDLESLISLRVEVILSLSPSDSFTILSQGKGKRR
jgi:endoglucanase